MARSDVFPALLKHWRTRRGLSQLDLAIAADVSARHVSFLETGRAQPSREMVLRLGATLNMPLRDQNAMLRAAGFEDEFPEPSVQDGLPAPIAQAIERMLAVHDPYPMILLDRRYEYFTQVNASIRPPRLNEASIVAAPSGRLAS